MHLASMNFWQQFLTDLSRGNIVSFLWGVGCTLFFSGWFVNFLNPSWGKFTGNATAPGNLIAAAGLVAFLAIVLYKIIISLRK